MVSPIELITHTILNISYERLIMKNAGIGVNGMVGFDDEFIITQVSPYYRIYFGKK